MTIIEALTAIIDSTNQGTENLTNHKIDWALSNFSMIKQIANQQLQLLKYQKRESTKPSKGS